MSGTVVYTAIFGPMVAKDHLYLPTVSPGTRCVAFMDVKTPQRLSGWEILPSVFSHVNAQRKARQHKLLSHVVFPSADYTLWVDGNFTPLCDPEQLVQRYLTSTDIAVFKHRQRSCVYEELSACLRLKKDDPVVMQRQIFGYKQEGYPANNGLAETCALIRRHSDQVRVFNELWWHELSNNSVRDQLSFDYCVWRQGMHYTTFSQDRLHCPYFQGRAHR